MALDLSALESDSPTPLPHSTQSGEPLLIPLADIEVDPNQPRKSFDPAKMVEMVASVKERGVKSPVSVRPHPDKPGKWVLNYGERRYRASIDAGLEQIPAFIDEKHDEYDQVIENLQREDLRPMELALFIARKKKDGDKNAHIARMLGVDASVITYHLALVDPPGAIEVLYSSGRCVSPKILYDLRTLHAKFPEEVDAWCEQAEEVTRAAVADLSAKLKGAGKTDNSTPQKTEADPADQKTLEHSKVPGGGSADAAGSAGGGDGGDEAAKTKARNNGAGPENGGSDEGGTEPPDGKTSWPRGKVASDPTLMKKPLLLVTVDGRSAAVLLNRKPSTIGLIHVCYENGENAEVSAADCVIDSLMEEHG